MAFRGLWSRIKAKFRKKDMICPFCFERFKLREAEFRCENMTCPGQKPDVQLKKIWNQDSRARVFAPDKVCFSSHCPACGVESVSRVCPRCHKKLPETFGLCEDFIIAVIGAKNVGKSHFLAVLIDHIRKHLGTRFDMTIEFMDEETNRRYLQNFYNPVFKEHRTIQVTRSARTDHTVRMPLLYRLSRRLNDTRLETLATLAFFDTAGEDMDDQQLMSQLHKYILNAHGIILLLDPLQIDAVRRKLPDLPLPAKESEPLDIMQRVTNILLRGSGYGQNAKITIPVAVCYSKFDAVLPLADPTFQILHKANHNRKFDKADCDAIQSEIEAMLLDWDYSGLVNLIKVRYRDYAFFCISALGCMPTGNRIASVTPFRIEDPFLWLLYKAGKIN